MKNGRPNAAKLKAIPEKMGEIVVAAVRATLVIPAVAVRSSESTTAIVYDLRVGTSIWETLIRSRKKSTASQAVGASGTIMSRTFDGRWVKTIVFSSPNRSAIQPAASSDKPDTTLTQKKTKPSVSGDIPH